MSWYVLYVIGAAFTRRRAHNSLENYDNVLKSLRQPDQHAVMLIVLEGKKGLHVHQLLPSNRRRLLLPLVLRLNVYQCADRLGYSETSGVDALSCPPRVVVQW